MYSMNEIIEYADNHGNFPSETHRTFFCSIVFENDKVHDITIVDAAYHSILKIPSDRLMIAQRNELIEEYNLPDILPS